MADIDIFSLQPSVISRDLKGKYILLYGAPKVGKTSFAVQAPRALVCAFEKGTNALSNVKAQPISKWVDFKKILSQLRQPRAKEIYDTVVIDTVSGIKAINNGAPYLLAANITFGNFFIASTGKDDDGIMNEGDKIVLFGQSQTPDLLFHYLYGKSFDSNIEYVANATAAAQCLASGKNVSTSSEIDYVFLAQPALYTILNNTNAPTYGKASIYKNIQEEYKAKTNNQELVQASVFVRKSEDKDYNKMLKTYLENLDKSINEAIENPTLVKESMDQLSSEEVTSIFQINSNAAKAVLEDNNGLGLGYKKALDNKQSIDSFISLFSLGATNEEIYFK